MFLKLLLERCCVYVCIYKFLLLSFKVLITEQAKILKMVSK